MLFRFTRIFVAIGLLGAVWLLVWMRRSDPAAAKIPPPAQGAVKILQFYASTGALARGDKAMLCYGVENARSVSIAPLSEPVTPAFSRCLEVSPLHTTHYTLMANGFDGKTATQSLTVAVNAAPPAPPRILHFAGTKQGGRRVKLCWKVADAERVEVDPPTRAPLNDAEGCFGVEPVKTTTYTLTATGAGNRKTSRQVIVEVDPSGG
jgi:hypothetical protein